MKILILSDLHTEFVGQFWDLPEDLPEFDVVVLAGDIAGSPAQGVAWAAERFGSKPTVYVPGNHEFYGASIETALVRGAGAAADWPHIRFLDRDAHIIGRVRFVGAILWTDYALLGSEITAMAYAARGLNDHVRIERRGPMGSIRFSPGDALDRHREDLAYLESALAHPFDGKTVVVTHHAPHPDSVARRFANDPLSPCFVSDLSELIGRFQPAAWFHGHTHDNFDYRVGATRVVCNPKGYGPRRPGQRLENMAFSMKVIEI